MAVSTVIFWVSLVLTVSGTNGSGELAVLHSPESLLFTGSSDIQDSALKEVYSACLGLSVEENSAWDGLLVIDPFKSPETVVEINVDGLNSLGDIANSKVKKYPLNIDEFQPDTFEAMRHRLQQRFDGSPNNLVNVRLSNMDELSSYSNIFGDITPQLHKQTYHYLKPDIDVDSKFLMELSALQAITDKVKSGAVSADNVIDFYSFRFSSLHLLSDYYGPNSPQTIEAKKLLGEELERMNNAFIKTYDGSVVMVVVTTDAVHTRRQPRSISEAQFRTTYPEDFAAIFNIFLWFGVIFVFTLIAIVYTLIDMDPGRDSIIYRMTSTRMKKDN